MYNVLIVKSQMKDAPPTNPKKGQKRKIKMNQSYKPKFTVHELIA